MTRSSDRQSRGRIPGLRLVLGLITLLGYMAASGCGVIQVTEATPPGPPITNVAPAPNTDERHDVAIMAVDFEPALDVDTILSGQPISLLVGIENMGNRRETGIMVRAILYNGDRTETLMTSTKRIASLASGGVTVARFDQDHPPARYDSYVLVVEITPLARETNLDNNRRVLNIEVRGAR